MDEKRRKLLLTGAAALGRRALPLSLAVPLAGWPARGVAQTSLPARIQFDSGPFPLGVASGDPTPDAVVLWTRLAPDPLAPQGGLASAETVWWAVATDEQFNDLVDLGAVTAKPEQAGAVHVDVTGLAPDTEYFYAFWDAAQVTSATGRTRTTPLGAVSSARFVFASCQSIGRGRYAAFERMVEEDPDFIVHLGDYIYESQLPPEYPAALRPAPADLEDYRLRHALYKGDAQLRSAHQAVPWIVTWDDHEVVNDCWNDPDPAFQARRAAAYQAWYEHMPIRCPAGLPNGPDFQIYRSLAYGDLLDLIMLDLRQYRDRWPCSRFSNPIGCPAPDNDDPNRAMLGTTQKQWLLNQLSGSTASWRCLGSPLIMADVKVGDVVGYSHTWQGTAAERTEILDHIAANDIDNVVVVSGDWHRSIASNLKVDFEDIEAPEVATEFMGPPVTSGDADPQGTFTFFQQLTTYPLNLHVRYLRDGGFGYVVCDVTASKWTSTYRDVDRDDPQSPATTVGVFEVVTGVPQVNMVSGSGENPYPPGA